MGDKESTALTPAFAQAGEFGSVAEVLKANMAGEAISPQDLEQVKVPSGGGNFWTIMTAEKPNGEPRESLEGVIMATNLGRLYFSQPLGQAPAGTPPDCVSRDSVTGVGNPGGSCVECHLAAYGSAPNGRGQACAQHRVMFMLSPDSGLPRVVIAPPTSLKGMRGYLTKLSGLGRPIWSVVSSLRLERAVNKDNQAYSRIVAQMVRTLTPEETNQMKSMAESLRQVFAAVDVSAAPQRQDEEL